MRWDQFFNFSQPFYRRMANYIFMCTYKITAKMRTNEVESTSPQYWMACMWRLPFFVLPKFHSSDSDKKCHCNSLHYIFLNSRSTHYWVWVVDRFLFSKWLLTACALFMKNKKEFYDSKFFNYFSVQYRLIFFCPLKSINDDEKAASEIYRKKRCLLCVIGTEST